ncbi:MAG: hypothetical protein UT82_C0014G0047 [Parcubacteria group bacterium GW2011_GWB1_40_14]|nr:MAG: hypothetical protein UT82_C0014G0047 [Parcubacteria group bacterium GW2011_GWB1_40_14]
MSDATKFTFIGVSRKPKMGGVEMGAFVVEWQGGVRRVTVAVEDELLYDWGYNKMGLRPEQEGPTLTQLLEMLGSYYLTELVALREEPHGYIFSKKDFLNNEGGVIPLNDVMIQVKSRDFILHRPHQYE